MERITIQVKDKNKATILFELLQSLDFVEMINLDEEETSVSEEIEVTDFFSLAGLWEGRDIKLDAIRKKAWPRQST